MAIPAWFNEYTYLNSKLYQLESTGVTDYSNISEVKAAIEAGGGTPYSHYLAFSLVERTNPDVYFNTNEYLAAKAAQLNSMAYEGDTTWNADKVALALQNAGFTNAYEHFAAFGWAENINPSNAFDVSSYLELKAAETGLTVDEVKAAFVTAGFDPISHYMAVGYTETSMAVTAVPADEQVEGDAGATLTLTDGLDQIVITTDNTVDTVKGILGSADATLNVADSIVGNGETIVQLVAAADETLGYQEISHVADVNLISADTSLTIDINAQGWADVGSVNAVSGVDGLNLTIDNLEAVTGLSVGVNVSADITANYTDGSTGHVWSDRGASMSYAGDHGDVVGAVVSGADASFSMYATSLQDDVALSVGDVAIAGSGVKGYAYVGVYNTTADVGADIAVGNVTVSGVSEFDLYVANTDHSATDTNTNITVGNIDVALNDDVAGTFADASMTIDNTGYNNVGDVIVGNVDLTVGANNYANLYITNSGYESAPSDDVTVGATTIGNIALDLATDASVDMQVNSYVYVRNGAGTLGDVTVGDVNINMGVNSVLDLTFSETAQASGTGEASIGNITVGNLTAHVDDGGDLIVYQAYGSADGDVGNLSAGSLDVTVGVSAEATVYYSIDASGDIGTFTRGNVNLVAGVDGYIWVSDKISGANVGDFTVGNVDLFAGKNAYVGYSAEASADSGDLGNITIGDVTITAQGEAADVDFSAWFSATDDIGDINVGNLTLLADGKSSTAQFSMTAQGDGAGSTIGDITFGDVSLTVKGESAYGELWVSASSADAVGDMTFGNFDLTIDNAAKKVGAVLEVDITNTAGDIILGDINLGSTSVRGATDITMAYSADFYAYADGNLTVGNIAVTGGDGESDNFMTLTNWLSLSATGTITIGNVDYSGYTGKSTVTNTIDVSGFKGAAEVIGSDNEDIISDNKGTNILTGNGDGDTFIFTTDNTGKTLTTMDSVTDFSNAAGDKLDVGVAPTVATYSEASFADFATFVTGANAANKDVFVGLVTDNGAIVAADYNADGTIDFMVHLLGVTDLGQIDVASFV